MRREVRALAGLVRAGMVVTETDVEALMRQFSPTGDSVGETRLYVDALRGFTGVALRVGIPLADVLAAVSAALDDDMDRNNQTKIAMRAPAVATRIVLFLPLVSLGILTALGFDPFPFLVGTPVGWMCIAVASFLIVLARGWTRRLVRGASVGPVLPGLALTVVAGATRAGVNPQDAIAACAQVFNSRAALLSCVHRDLVRAKFIVERARRWGVALVPLLVAEAQEMRTDARTAALSRVASLGEKILLPLGVCVLPAFLLLVAVPAVVSTMSTTTLYFR